MAGDRVTVATTSAGAGARSPRGEAVEVPIEDLRGARGLIAGAPDAGTERATAALVDGLIAAGQPTVLVDPDGSYRDAVGEHDACVVGGGPDCDRRVERPDADRLVATVTEAEQCVVLDCASTGSAVDPTDVVGGLAEVLDGGGHGEPSVVLLLGDCHEWLPDAGESACAGALSDLGAGSASDVGVVGVTDRPGAVDAGFRRDCDWVAAHRMTWREHVDAVSRILGRDHGDALETLEDGEAFLRGPWLAAVERVRFEPARTGGGASARDASRGPPAGGDVGGSRRRAIDAGVDDPGLSAGVAAIRDRIADLEAAVAGREGPTVDVEALADAVADRLDERGVTATGGGDGGGAAGTAGAVGRERAASGGSEDETADQPGGFGAVFDALGDAGGDGDPPAGTRRTDATGGASEHRSAHGTSDGADDDGGGMSFEPMDFVAGERARGDPADSGDVPARRTRSPASERRVPRYVRDTVRTVEEMDPTTRAMLARYVDRGADTPLNAHYAAGDAGDRTTAYAHNRRLRTTGLVEHVGRGHYAPTIPEKVRDAADRELSDDEVATAAAHVRRALF